MKEIYCFQIQTHSKYTRISQNIFVPSRDPIQVKQVLLLKN